MTVTQAFGFLLVVVCISTAVLVAAVAFVLLVYMSEAIADHVRENWLRKK